MSLILDASMSFVISRVIGTSISQNHNLVLDLLKVCLCVKLESSVLHDLLCKSTCLD